MDLTNITTIEKSSTKRQRFDLRYTASNSRFQVSDAFFASHNLDKNGFQFHLADDNGKKVALVSIHDNEDSIFFKGQDSRFSYNIMEDTLKELGMVDKDEKVTNYELELVGEKDGVQFFAIQPWEAEAKEEAIPTDEDGDVDTSQEEIVDDEPEDTVAPEPEDEEDEEPFI